jgi:hypothetical protein
MQQSFQRGAAGLNSKEQARSREAPDAIADQEVGGERDE